MFKKKVKMIIPFLVALLFLSGSAMLRAQGDSDDSSENSNDRRNPNVMEIPREMTQYIGGNNEFSLEIYRQLVDENAGNLLLSTHGIYAAISMLYAGTRGETAQQIAGTMRFPVQKTGELQNGFRAFLDRIKMLSPGSGENKDVEISIANAIWGMKDLEFHSTYLQSVRKEFKSDLVNVDFGNTGEAAKTINDWTASNTANRIREIINPGKIDKISTLVLTDAVYYKGRWKSPFSPDATVNLPFKTFTNEELRVPMMKQDLRCGYIDSVNYQAVKLPFINGGVSMVIYLPRAFDGLKHVEERFSPDIMNRVFNTLRNDNVSLTLPRFSIETGYSLKKCFSEMGMGSVFSAKADYSGMVTPEQLKKIQDTGKSLALSDVLHQSFLSIDEAGMGVQANSAAEVKSPDDKPGKSHPIVFVADHPFLFIIYHEDTGTILSMGRVLKP